MGKTRLHVRLLKRTKNYFHVVFIVYAVLFRVARRERFFLTRVRFMWQKVGILLPKIVGCFEFTSLREVVVFCDGEFFCLLNFLVDVICSLSRDHCTHPTFH